MNDYTPDIYDADPDAARVCETPFKSYGRRSRFSGPCMTVRVHEDHRPSVQLFKEPGQGRVLVIDGGGLTRIAILGATMSANAVRNGWAGAIVYGAIRDTEELRDIDLGVKALCTTVRKSLAANEHETNIPLHFGGVTFHPGDWVYADSDGVIVRATAFRPRVTSDSANEYQ